MGRRGLMGAFGAYMRQSALRKFRQSGDDERRWPPLATSTIMGRRDVRAAKRRSRANMQRVIASIKPLIDTGDLWRSITYVATEDSAEAGTTIPYAIFHQLGAPRTHLPARPFLTMDRRDVRRFDSLIDRYMERVLGA